MSRRRSRRLCWPVVFDPPAVVSVLELLSPPQAVAISPNDTTRPATNLPDRPIRRRVCCTLPLTAWRRAGLEAITPHEARHTFASLMIAAGVNAKALATYMGHSSITITLDRYGHLFPGNEEEAAGLLDAYLARADTTARLAQIG